MISKDGALINITVGVILGLVIFAGMMVYPAVKNLFDMIPDSQRDQSVRADKSTVPPLAVTADAPQAGTLPALDGKAEAETGKTVPCGAGDDKQPDQT